MRRWIVFNAVGVIGFGVQLSVLAVLLGLSVSYLAATAVAVETAVLHNFVWHEHWTWKDRTSTGEGRAGRLVRFHLLNGLLSLAGNLAGTWGLVHAGVTPLLANAASVVACALLTFAAGDRIVFVASQGSRRKAWADG